jgi:hypothetical protein
VPRERQIDKPDARANIRPLITSAIAVERAEEPPPRMELLGWL